MKRIFKEHSKLLYILCLLESILSIYLLMYFNYMDKLNYSEVSVKTYSDLALLIENMYTSTWWALIISFIIIITVFTITSIIYKKQYLHFISILLWIMLFILAIDFTKSFTYNLSNCAIFIPIIILNIFGYRNEKDICNL